MGKMPIKTFNMPNTGHGESLAIAVIVGGQYLVNRNGVSARTVTILDTRISKNGVREVYVSFVGQDKRLDTWVKESELEEIAPTNNTPVKTLQLDDNGMKPNEQNASNTPIAESSIPKRTLTLEPSPSVASTPEREHAAMTRVRNFEDVRFGEYLIKTWYYSPYPMPIDEHQNTSSSLTTPGRASSPTTTTLTTTPASSSKKRKLTQVENGHAHAHAHEATATSICTNQGQNQSQLHRSISTRTVNDMFAAGVGKGGEGARGRLWVCDLCFKYMRTRTAWDRHTSSCSLLLPPGRKVYQRGSYTMWEVDGASATLYCQNLSLFGKLFIDHKSIFFHVENFLFYVLCDAATSRRDQVMAFFSKEKLSYDDYNLACIVTFPPFQNRGFGKLLIEFSYYLTKYPSTRPITLSPGTPERPLSDLGLKGYLAYWISVILRFLRRVLKDAPSFKVGAESPKKARSPVKSAGTVTEGRTLRARKEVVSEDKDRHDKVVDGNAELIKSPIAGYKGQYSVSLTLVEIAQACHLRVDDTAFTLTELGMLKYRRSLPLPAAANGINNHDRGRSHSRRMRDDEANVNGEEGMKEEKQEEKGEWKDVQVVISKEMVDQAFTRWRVKEKGVLDEEYVLL